MKNDKELTIEFRNSIAARLIEAKANLFYWKEIVRLAKSNSSQKAEAFRSIEINKDKIAKDTLFLGCIDKMLKGYK